MAINRPVTKTLISTTAWGIPITDQVNANATDIAAMKPTGWTNATLQNGWTNVAGQQAAQYRKVGDIVYLRGRIASGSVPSTAWVLPVGFRPPVTITIASASVSGNWVFGVFEVWADGSVVPGVGYPAGFLMNAQFSTI